MPDTVDPRITTAREYLTRARRRTITTMPPLALMHEVAETRKQLGHALDAAALMVSLTEHSQPDQRITWGLVIDVLGVLDRHGFQCPDEQHTGRAIVIIGELVRAYTGEDA
jgi:predicted hydrolase (HD superfamily)